MGNNFKHEKTLLQKRKGKLTCHRHYIDTSTNINVCRIPNNMKKTAGKYVKKIENSVTKKGVKTLAWQKVMVCAHLSLLFYRCTITNTDVVLQILYDKTATKK